MISAMNSREADSLQKRYRNNATEMPLNICEKTMRALAQELQQTEKMAALQREKENTDHEQTYPVSL